MFSLFCAIPVLPAPARAEPVRAVLFYSPDCPHCKTVINDYVAPLFNKEKAGVKELYIKPADKEKGTGPSVYNLSGESLDLLLINTRTPVGSDLFRSAVAAFTIPKKRQGVPLFIAGSRVLIGSTEIAAAIQDVLEKGERAAWPDIGGLSHVFAKLVPVPPQRESGSTAVRAEDEPRSIAETFRRDPAGNSLAILILTGMAAAVVWTLLGMPGKPPGGKPIHDRISVPVLCSAGIIIAGYLTYIELTDVEAICGPIGDCNTVQQSEYARLLGVVPIGLLGLLDYLVILSGWTFARLKKGATDSMAWIVIFFGSFTGVIFSIYLTFLEPFVIGATCIWCLLSAIIITVLMLVSAPGLRAALDRVHS